VVDSNLNTCKKAHSEVQNNLRNCQRGGDFSFRTLIVMIDISLRKKCTLYIPPFVHL